MEISTTGKWGALPRELGIGKMALLLEHSTSFGYNLQHSEIPHHLCYSVVKHMLISLTDYINCTMFVNYLERK